VTGEVAPEEFCAVPVEYHIDHKARLVTITGRGNVVLEEILDCMHAIAAQDVMLYATLFDTREAVGVFSDSDIMTMGAWAQANASYDQRGAAAIVATGAKAIEKHAPVHEPCHRGPANQAVRGSRGSEGVAGSARACYVTLPHVGP
jgi:hypothetical protein